MKQVETKEKKKTKSNQKRHTNNNITLSVYGYMNQTCITHPYMDANWLVYGTSDNQLDSKNSKCFSCTYCCCCCCFSINSAHIHTRATHYKIIVHVKFELDFVRLLLIFDMLLRVHVFVFHIFECVIVVCAVFISKRTKRWLALWHIKVFEHAFSNMENWYLAGNEYDEQHQHKTNETKHIYKLK